MIENLLKPHLADFCQIYKDHSIYDYYVLTLNHGSQVSEEFIEESIKNIQSNYDNVDKNRIYKALNRQRFIYSANHCGFENYHHVLHSTLLTQLTLATYLDTDNVIYSCSSLTPLNQTAPTGFLFGKRDKFNDYKRKSLNFISRKYDSSFLSSVPIITKRSIENRLKFFDKSVCEEHELKAIDDLLLNIDSYKQSSFIAQTSTYNSQKINEFLQKGANNITYFVDQERLAIKLIVNDLKKEDSKLAPIFNNPFISLKLIKALSNYDNLWSKNLIFLNNPKDLGYGTVLFYYIKKNGSRSALRLQVKDKKLFLVHKDFELLINAENICKALCDGCLMPNIYMTYMPMIYLHKASIIGGIFLTHYIKNMINITAKVLNISPKTYYLENFMQSFITPFKVNLIKENNTINHARPMSLLDLVSIKSLTTSQIDNVMHSKILQSLPLSQFESIMESTQYSSTIEGNEKELIELLKASAPFEIDFCS